MFDPAQILLFVVIIILTTLLVVLGIQVYFILKELRITIDKTNKVLDNADRVISNADIIAESVAIPVSSLSNLIMGLKTGAGFANIVRRAVDFGTEGDKNGK
jgi:hypothetical protein